MHADAARMLTSGVSPRRDTDGESWFRGLGVSAVEPVWGISVKMNLRGRRCNVTTYSAPELLLVGTAHNLVLGFGVSASPSCEYDSVAPTNSTQSDLAELW
jgi:hypothetical protein